MVFTFLNAASVLSFHLIWLIICIWYGWLFFSLIFFLCLTSMTPFLVFFLPDWSLFSVLCIFFSSFWHLSVKIFQGSVFGYYFFSMLAMSSSLIILDVISMSTYPNLYLQPRPSSRTPDSYHFQVLTWYFQ